MDKNIIQDKKTTDEKIKASKAYPVELHIEPTNNCNLDCKMCPRRESNREVGYMDIELFKKIIDEAVSYHKGINTNFHKDGEPLLHPDIVEMVAYASGKGCVTHFNTNGLLLNEEKSKGLIEAGLDHLTVSLSAPTVGGYAKLKKKAEDFKKLEENVKRFMDIKKELNAPKPFVRVKMLVMDETKEFIQDFKDKWNKIADEAIVRETHNWDGTAKTITSDSLGNNKGRFPCVKLWTNPAINWDGTVSLCCIDWNCRGIIGDLKENTLHEIWTSEKFQLLRKAHLGNRYAPLCEKCKAWSLNCRIDNGNFW